MKDEQDYMKDIAEMRSMMERSSRFMSLSGLAGVMVGIYALVGAYIAHEFLYFKPDQVFYDADYTGGLPFNLRGAVLLATSILVLALGTAAYLSHRNAKKRGEKFWNPTSRRLLINMAIPLIAGGVLILIMISKGLIGLIAPFTLIFYGLALYNAGKFTYEEVKSLGLIEIALGLTGTWFIGYGLLFWALGFGVAHIVYGIYMHYRYER
jgi:hypothetical protein